MQRPFDRAPHLVRLGRAARWLQTAADDDEPRAVASVPHAFDLETRLAVDAPHLKQLTHGAVEALHHLSVVAAAVYVRAHQQRDGGDDGLRPMRHKHVVGLDAEGDHGHKHDGALVADAIRVQHDLQHQHASDADKREHALGVELVDDGGQQVVVRVAAHHGHAARDQGRDHLPTVRGAEASQRACHPLRHGGPGQFACKDSPWRRHSWRR